MSPVQRLRESPTFFNLPLPSSNSSSTHSSITITTSPSEEDAFDTSPKVFNMEMPETHVIILIAAGVAFGMIILYEVIRTHWAKCRGRDSEDAERAEEAKSSSCQKLEEPPPSYESLFPWPPQFFRIQPHSIAPEAGVSPYQRQLFYPAPDLTSATTTFHL